MNLFDVGLRCNEQCPKHRRIPTIGEADVVVVWPAARTFVVNGTTELNRNGCTDRLRIGVGSEMQYGLMNVRRAFGIHRPEGSVA